MFMTLNEMLYERDLLALFRYNCANLHLLLWHLKVHFLVCGPPMRPFLSQSTHVLGLRIIDRHMPWIEKKNGGSWMWFEGTPLVGPLHTCPPAIW